MGKTIPAPVADTFCHPGWRYSDATRPPGARSGRRKRATRVIPYYLEFHAKDSQSGLHYCRVTGGPEKAPYDPEKARERVESQAEHFVSLLRQEAFRLEQETSNPEPLIVSPYDGELFGHWWHEGVDWIDRVFRRLAGEEAVRTASLAIMWTGGRKAFPRSAWG